MGVASSAAGGLFDVAVVIPTVLRPELGRAVRSIFAQKFPGRVQILIGIDKPLGDRAAVDHLLAECPAHMRIAVIDPGYSTAKRHGGLYPSACGGSLRTILSYAAHSPLIAYLDDDNWWAEDHLETLSRAVKGHAWAFSLRWFVDEKTEKPLAVDEWESVGPGKGIWKHLGGFVDPSSLLIDIRKCEPALRLWSFALPEDPKGTTADRMVFGFLKEKKFAATGKATSYYVMQAGDPMHRKRMGWIAGKVGGGNPQAGG